MLEFVQFFVMHVIPAFRRGIVSRVWKRPTTDSFSASVVAGAAAGAVVGAVLELCRGKHELIVENTLLRQQLIVLRRQVNCPQPNNTDRALLVLVASRLRTCRSALFIVQPDTLLRWHRAGFHLFWKRKSKTTSQKPKLAAEIIGLIKQMALENRLWGAERIRGELLNLDIRVSKRTIQKYMHQARDPRPSERKRKPNQNWSTFLHNHTNEMWAVDFLPVYDLFFRPLFVFFI